MDSEEAYHPTQGDILSVLRLLHDNGVSVQNSKRAYEELQQYQANPAFCVLLSYVFGAENCPIQNLELGGSWIQYRRLAGITLKNNLEKSEYALGLAAVKEAARCALFVLGNPIDVRIARVAAQIVVKITALTSFDWWRESGIGDLPHLLLNELFRAGDVKTLSSLYTLQYLMEDLPKVVGVASKEIIERVVTLVLDQSIQPNLRKAAFRMCSNVYERAESLDWNVEGLSPLQNGLTGASGIFAGVCTTLLEQGCDGDIALMIEVLRSCSVMLEYLEYFNPISESEMTRLVKWWVYHTINIVSSKETVSEYDFQLKIAAMDLLTTALGIYDRMGGEGVISLLVEPISQCLSTLIPALVNFVPMSREEVDSILSNDDYRLRDAMAVDYHLEKRNEDISEDKYLDDDEEGAPALRSSALRCIDALSMFSSKQVYPYLIDQVKNLWDSDGRLKEAAIVLIGTIASGCYNEIENTLPVLVHQLVNSVISPSEDVFVVSIAIWTLSRILEWAYACDGTFITDIMTAFITRMQSTSKRIQRSAVSALNTAFVTAHNMGTTRKIIAVFPSLVEAIIACLPVYCDANLSLLSDLALHLIAVSENTVLNSHIGEAFKSNRIERAKLFENSYVSVYIKELPNTHLDKDLFSIDRVISGFLTFFPDPVTSVNILESWQAALEDVVNRDVKDDTDLLYNIIYSCGNFINVTSTTVLREWAHRTQGSLASVGFQLLVKSPQQTVKLAAVILLHRLLKNIGSSAYPMGMAVKLLSTLASSIDSFDDPHVKLELVRLITLMVECYSSEFPNESYAAFFAAVNAIRSDAYNDSLMVFVQMAYDICRTLGMVPTLISRSRPEVITRIMAQSENTYDKSVATIHLINALLTIDEVALAILPDAMRLIYSWQQSACNFPGTQEKIRSLLFFYDKHGSQLRDHLGALHPNTREMIFTTYDMI
ncbi:uncharacterized protein TM35_000372080 [Trypanosoma theileri]|uniref:Transportin2-like protein n=1 Tax=Trypanosoma theileri TaxID=67003 RepID=A0A1X0NKI1_9TRYP|nr:uncharacterized protein TM35_000372080 [Trypanosoma theileri]ORC85235.1 hypothetical protein TM35_000372080 [Trypanosoma theileri]